MNLYEASVIAARELGANRQTFANAKLAAATAPSKAFRKIKAGYERAVIEQMKTNITKWIKGSNWDDSRSKEYRALIARN